MRDYLAAQVFDRLGLRMVLDPLGHTQPRAVSYAGRGGSFDPLHSGLASVGDGGVQTTPGELVRWADNYRTGRVGGQALLDAIVTDAAESTDPGYRYGAGIFAALDGSLTHHGQWLGYETSFWISADRHTSVASSCNLKDFNPDSLRSTIASAWTR